MNESKRKRRAFGFLEISVLVLVIAFIVLVSVPNYVGSRISPSNACINNLRIIDAAKQEWAIENKITNGETVVTEAQILNYLGRVGKMPKCPSGGKYTIGKLSEVPTCSLGTNISQGHILPP
jgi:competence protein ComGC